MHKVTDKDKENFNILYLKLGTYAAVARETGFSAGTVKKYIIPNYSIIDKNDIVHFNSEITPLDKNFKIKDWGELTILTEQERKDLIDLRKEISI